MFHRDGVLSLAKFHFLLVRLPGGIDGVTSDDWLVYMRYELQMKDSRSDAIL